MAKPAKKKSSRKSLETFERKLLTQREELLRQQAELQAARPEPDEGAEEGDAADHGSATFERERDWSVAQNVRDLLDQVDHALQRIEEGTYGTCERCGKKIEAARLRALPHAALCIECKKRDERRW